jgi:hypothetical protein
LPRNGFVLVICGTILASLLVAGSPIKAAKVTGGGLEASETHLPVPFFYQEKDYYCGPATLEMVFDYYGENISQSEIACVARSIGDPLYVTYTDELRRAGHFSNISTSMGNELTSNITGYSLRQLGYAAFESQGVSLTILKNLLYQGKPVILLMWYSGHHVSTHYRVATGYNETHIFLHDPWNRPLWGGTYGGPDIAFNNSEFLDLWSYYSNWTLYVSPWTVSFSAPCLVMPGIPFQVESTVTYPQALPNALSTFPASSCNASITLPPGLSLVQGENEKKKVGDGSLQAGNSPSLSWTMVANSSVNGLVTMTVEGIVSGSVWANPEYPAYSYSDRIGATVNFTVNIAVTYVQPSKTVVGHGYNLNVSVVVVNQRNFTQDFSVTVYANETAVQTENVTLASESLTAITLMVNTSSLTYGNYSLTAQIKALSSENQTTSNSFNGSIAVTIPGDIKADFVVDIFDAITLAVAFNAIPASSNWNPNADINNDYVVDIYDAIILASHFTQHYP